MRWNACRPVSASGGLGGAFCSTVLGASEHADRMSVSGKSHSEKKVRIYLWITPGEKWFLRRTAPPSRLFPRALRGLHTIARRPAWTLGKRVASSCPTVPTSTESACNAPAPSPDPRERLCPERKTAKRNPPVAPAPSQSPRNDRYSSARSYPASTPGVPLPFDTPPDNRPPPAPSPAGPREPQPSLDKPARRASAAGQ